MFEKFKFLRGEKRKITYEISSRDESLFNINDCEVVLKNSCNSKKIDFVIVENIITFIVDTADLKSGHYTIVCTFWINEEIIKKEIKLEVI